jgi:5-formyltetrahydrofolate cyclo-ligase
MGFYPLKGEVDLLEMMRKESGKRYCFPVIDLANKRLLAYEVKNFDEDFCKGPYGVMQPDARKSTAIDPEEIDMILVPGLAFDRSRNRLGRGGGYYDRFLKNLLPAKFTSVGVAFDFQILETLPIDPAYDEKVNCVVNEHILI